MRIFHPGAIILVIACPGQHGAGQHGTTNGGSDWREGGYHSAYTGACLPIVFSFNHPGISMIGSVRGPNALNLWKSLYEVLSSNLNPNGIRKRVFVGPCCGPSNCGRAVCWWCTKYHGRLPDGSIKRAGGPSRWQVRIPGRGFDVLGGAKAGSCSSEGVAYSALKLFP